MCGIFGYIGPKNPLTTVLKGLKALEYRGYDSAGLAGIKNDRLYFWKEVGKVAELEKEITSSPAELDVAIAQTRWATHGGVTKANAHPHLDNAQKMALVHNGIIENYASLKAELIQEGFKFLSETDTEVIVNLISKYYKGDILKAVQTALPRLKGAFAFVLIHTDYPDTMIAVANECPLVIGIGQNEAFVSSDYHAFAFHTRQVMYLSSGEIAIIKANKQEVLNIDSEKIPKAIFSLNESSQESSKGDYSHFTLKEIFEQPLTLKSALVGRILEDYGTATFEGLMIDEETFAKTERILILGCGTSYHAGLVASYMFEQYAHLPVQVEISSEFRYKNPVIQPNTLVIALSQSGETADTIAAMRELKAKGAPILAICNVYGSTMTREANGCIFLRAGPEIGVCSTKAFTSQLAILALITLKLARMHHMTKQEGCHFLLALEVLPDQLKEVLAQDQKIQALAKKYSDYQNFFFLGRNYMYPTALEGALKLKEISYINANGYPAGEMKHGPIALISPDCPTVALCQNQATYSKILSNLMEVKARNGKILALVEEGSKGIEEIADDIIWIPKTIDLLAPILSTVVTQLLAFHIAVERNADIDHPRNLAKSVTVE
jgi:glucosamine--fructose-6-phosphate aminotransferase (isomerizing)